ncbi:tetratricopeptide repeat protein [Brevundimonas naejangsanensis]|uniref:Tetratricopeptide repeat protein n=1 Tax=Brevundimonas naejangsanensis TaxID=588932 RepID=A0A494RMC0_9CAUL|nr:tetratricopeptide repeat protein [Brevundimonas naejangsanensis]AYG95152.1 tetratricopeptide repeat protein [Brevundimonas naejangsanensis]
MRFVAAKRAGALALVLGLMAPMAPATAAAAAMQAAGPGADAAAPKVTVNIVDGELSRQERADLQLLERAMRDVQARGYAGLDRHLPGLRRALDGAPAAYAQMEQRDKGEWIIRSDDLGEVMVLATVIQSLAGGEGVRAVTVRRQANVYPLIALILGSEAVERRRLDDAVKILDRGLALQGDDWMLVKEKASALQVGGRHDEALAVLDQALASDSLRILLNAGPLHRGRGFSLIEQGRLKEARAAYDAALELDAEDGLAKAQLAYIDGLEAGQPPVAPSVALLPGPRPGQ